MPFVAEHEPPISGEAKEKYAKSKLPAEYSGYWVKKISLFIEKEKPHLDPKITLTGLSDKIGIPPYHLSQIINTSLGSTFYDLINNYRIEEVKKLLAGKNNMTILDIALTAGFNSKTTFNTVFKKTTGFTPKEYKNSL